MPALAEVDAAAARVARSKRLATEPSAEPSPEPEPAAAGVRPGGDDAPPGGGGGPAGKWWQALEIEEMRQMRQATWAHAGGESRQVSVSTSDDS